jgi:IclR family pca regulon transcriptional regulator
VPRLNPRPSDSVPRLCEPRFSQSLERGLAILECFSAEQRVRGIADMADELGMSRSTTHRYVITLVALGYLEQDERRKYRLGLRVTDLGMAVLNAIGLREHAHSYMEDLSRRSSFTVSLAVLDSKEIVYVEHVRGMRSAANGLRPRLAVGSRLPAYCTAMGKVLLASLPEYELPKVLADIRLAKRAPGTITRKPLLRAELAHVREKASRPARRSWHPNCNRSPPQCAPAPRRWSPRWAWTRPARRSGWRASWTSFRRT